MPHDKNGRKIDKGDVVKGHSYSTEKRECVLVGKVYEGTDTCNLFVHHFDVRTPSTSMNAKDCELVLKADGSDPGADEAKAATPA